MSDTSNTDISKIVSLIMDNPKLIEEIANLAKKEGISTESVPEVQAAAPSEADTVGSDEPSEAIETAAPVFSGHSGTKAARSQLLGALKPYVSKERARAIDSMLSIADIFDMMRAR